MTELTREQYEAKAEARFWKKVSKSDECWNWTGRKSDNGYGFFHVKYPNAEKALTVRAHRYAWSIDNGPIPSGIEIDHKCHNTLCVRPSHLRSATRKQNSENRQGASRASKSGVRGVFWAPDKEMWRAKIRHNKRDYHIGYFHDLHEAGEAARAKRLELHTHNIMDRASQQLISNSHVSVP
jgi:HNH endonuclease